MKKSKKTSLISISRISAAKQDFNLIINRIDQVVLHLRNYGRKELVHDHRFNEQEPKVENLEKRVTTLENFPR